jgi:hypothetical protein
MWARFALEDGFVVYLAAFAMMLLEARIILRRVRWRRRTGNG